MKLIKTIFSRKWIVTTLLVLVGMAVMIRLGIWQLDRLEQRRAANAALTAVLASEPLDLTKDPLPADVESLQDRKVQVTGEFDLAAQVALLVQKWNGRAGVHLITPLRIAGSDTAVLVDRGWIPQADFDAGNLAAYDIPGLVQVEGVIVLSQNPPRYGNPDAAPSGPQTAVYRIDVAQLQAQLPYELLPIYVIQAPPPEGNVTPPFRELPPVDLSEGSHLSYALQWFLFTLILGGGYLMFVRRQGQKSQAETSSAPGQETHE